MLCGGTCLQDIELRRQDEVYLDALGAQRIPDPTTAGDFCRRFDEAGDRGVADGDQRDAGAGLARAAGGVFRRGGHRRGRDVGRDDRGVQGRDGHLLQRGVGLSPAGRVAGQHAEPLYLVNRSGNRPSAEGAAERFDQARALCRDAGFRRITFRGDTDFTQTRAPGSLGRRRGAVRLRLRRARESDRASADALPARRWTPVGAAPGRTRSRPSRAQRPVNVKAATIVDARVQEPAARRPRRSRSFPISRRRARSRTAWWSSARTSRSSRATAAVRRDSVLLLSHERSRDARGRRSSSWPTTAATRRT